MDSSTFDEDEHPTFLEIEESFAGNQGMVENSGRMQDDSKLEEVEEEDH